MEFSNNRQILESTEIEVKDISGSSTLKVKGKPLKNDKYFVVHHTGGRGTAAGVVNILNSRGLGIQWVIDRDGKLYKTLPSGSLGYHVVPNKPGAPKDLSNQTAQGVEIIGSNDNDILEKQCVTTLRLVKKLGYPLSNIYGHGELQSNKMSTEGQKCKKFIIANFDKTEDFTFSNSEEKNPTDKSNTQTQQTQQIQQDDEVKFTDLLRSNVQNRDEKYKNLLKKYFGENIEYGLKKRSSKLNEEINKLRKLF